MEVLARLGLETVVLSPGSRSTPLALAAVRNSKLEAISVLDERSAAFFALGIAKRTHKPVALVCTSGSAVANYLPAVVEASLSGTPLLLLTADRPPELRNCSSGQTIDQLKIFGDFVREFTEVALPGTSPRLLGYLRQTLVHAVERCLLGDRGPVHLNFPFRDPLHPESVDTPVVEVELLEASSTVIRRPCESVVAPSYFDAVAIERLSSHHHGLIVVGDVNPADGDESFADAVAMLSEKLGWPVLADVLNPLRGHAGELRALVGHYDAILRDPNTASSLQPTAVLQIGPLPTSKVLRKWLSDSDAVAFLLTERPINTDPLHRVATPLLGSAHVLAEQLGHLRVDADWVARWVTEERSISEALDGYFEPLSTLFEGKIAWLLSHHLPVGSSVYFASSMSVRYAEFFWSPGSRACSVFANRGANGIDGTLGTAMGIAHGGEPAFLLTGDLAFLHDSNALLIHSEMKGSLTVILVNNQGGGIFEHLPVAQNNPDFESTFATPQSVDFAQLCAAHGISHYCIRDWTTLTELIEQPQGRGVRVIEVRTNRKADVTMLRELLSKHVNN